MVEFCIRDAVLEYHRHLTEGRTPHIIWANHHAYVITEQDFPNRIYCHDGNPRTTSGLIQRILDDPSSNRLGEIKDYYYEIFKDQVI